MSDSDRDQPEAFGELEPLPGDAELVDLPDDAELADLPAESELSELPAEALGQANPPADVQPPPTPARETAPVPALKPTPAPAEPGATPADGQAAPRGAMPVKGAVTPPGGGSRRERMERDREEQKSKKKIDHWVRWAGPGEKPRRDMEKAPAILRKAALGLLIGCLFPWGGVTPDWIGNVAEKLLVLGGLFVWHQSHLLRDGSKVPGFISSLGANKFMPLFILAGVLAATGFLPIFSLASLAGEGSSDNFGPFAEKGFLILAGLTMTHIYDYEHGGRFNPMFPIMFLAPGMAGVMALLKVFSADPIGGGQILSGLGSVLVGVAGWMAAYTMYVAMKEAKAHGDAKKRAQTEARKAAREGRTG